MKMRLLNFVFVVLFFCIADLVQAVPVTIQISGIVTSASGYGLPSTIYEGINFSGSYTYDSLTPDSDTASYSGRYKHSSPYGMNISLGGYQFQTATNHIDGFNIGIGNDDPYAPPTGPKDWYSVYCNAFIPSGGITINSFIWNLFDISCNALSSDALSIIAPIIADWDSNTFALSGTDNNGKGLSIHGTVTQAVLVPEPLTISLFAMGLS
ncbi:MAG TPA: hypothetical protein DCP47_09240, partial [Phycisphaerales bacterium]|nr:hypothetical protein [Phycisphaerales bacterium]